MKLSLEALKEKTEAVASTELLATIFRWITRSRMLTMATMMKTEPAGCKTSDQK